MALCYEPPVPRARLGEYVFSTLATRLTLLISFEAPTTMPQANTSPAAVQLSDKLLPEQLEPVVSLTVAIARQARPSLFQYRAHLVPCLPLVGRWWPAWPCAGELPRIPDTEVYEEGSPTTACTPRTAPQYCQQDRIRKWCLESISSARSMRSFSFCRLFSVRSTEFLSRVSVHAVSRGWVFCTGYVGVEDCGVA